MFDVTLQPLQIEVASAEDHLELQVIIGIMLPAGPGQMLPIPAGMVRIPMNKETAMDRAEAILDAAEELPDPAKPSNLVVASSLAGVDQAVRTAESFKGR